MTSTLLDTVNEARSAAPVSARQEQGRRLRVCMLAYAFYENDTRILQYASALAERGDSVDVIALARSEAMPTVEKLDGVRVHRIQVRRVDETGVLSYMRKILLFCGRAILFLWKQRRRSAYDIIHVHNAPDFLVFAALPFKRRGTAIVLDIHDLLPEFYASKFKISRDAWPVRLLMQIERWSAAVATHVVVANHLWCDRLAQRSFCRDRCSVIRNRPDRSIFQAATEGMEENARFLLTYPGSLNWHQGLDVAIRAFAGVANQITDADFHIYGEGSAKASLVSLVAQLGMEQRIFFHEPLPSREIAKVMARTDLAIEPKRSRSPFGNEALSTKIMEFMCLGVPVIACRTTVHALYYDDSLLQYYDDDDEDQLGQQIVRLRLDPALRAQLAANAMQYVNRNTWDARKHEYLALVDSLAQRSAVPYESAP